MSDTAKDFDIGDYIIIPGGRKRRSLVKHIRNKKIYNSEIIRPRKKQILSNRAGHPPDIGIGTNWITAAWLQNTTPTPISLFSSTLIVPQQPTNQSNQLIYFFNAGQPADSSFILQPVLQWGSTASFDNSPNGSGPFWTIATWLVYSGANNGSGHVSQHIPVAPGQKLTGTIKVLQQDSSGFVYSCEFEGFPQTYYQTDPLPELTWFMETLEAYETRGVFNPPYDLSSQDEYPPENNISFTEINIMQGEAYPLGNWIPVNYVTAYGEQAVIVSNSCQNGVVQLDF
jgi:hypothetical protein